MRVITFVSSVVITSVGIIGSASAADEFDTLKGVKAVPMASSELGAVKGLHVHFLDPQGGLHFAGNPENQGVGTGNWYDNDSPEANAGHLVAPSYHGLCVAAGTPSGIVIPPTGPGGVPTLPQCP